MFLRSLGIKFSGRDLCYGIWFILWISFGKIVRKVENKFFGNCHCSENDDDDDDKFF